MNHPIQTALSLALADGVRWIIRAGDAQAERIVSAVGAAMRLRPGRDGRELVAVVSDEYGAPPTNLEGPGPAVCSQA